MAIIPNVLDEMECESMVHKIWDFLEHIDYNDSMSKASDKYMKMIGNAMCGSTDEETKNNYERIVKNITKEVVIDKK